MEVVELADMFRNDGVVAIDLADGKVGFLMTEHAQAFTVSFKVCGSVDVSWAAPCFLL